MYAELSITSNFTFLVGASHAEEYVERATALDLPAIAIADDNSVAGIVRAHTRARQIARLVAERRDWDATHDPIGPIGPSRPAGLPAPRSFPIHARPRLIPAARLIFADAPPITVLPISRAGWGNLCLALGLRGTLKTGTLSGWGIALYSLSALGIMTTALFPVDAPGEVTTLIGRIHRIAAGSGILLELAALFVFSAAFGQQDPWRQYKGAALLLSIIAAIAVVAFVVGVQLDFAKGVLERLVLAVFLVWGILVSLVLLREPSLPT